jgi:hypothetical protein
LSSSSVSLSGEVTECLLSWQATGQKTGSAPLPQQSAPSQVNGRAPFIPPKIARQRASAQDDPPSLPAGSFLDIVATDPVSLTAPLAVADFSLLNIAPTVHRGSLHH